TAESAPAKVVRRQGRFRAAATGQSGQESSSSHCSPVEPHGAARKPSLFRARNACAFNAIFLRNFCGWRKRRPNRHVMDQVMALAILASQPDRTALAKGNNLLHLHEVRQAANLKAQPELLAVLGPGTNVNAERRGLIDHQGPFPAVPQPQRGFGTRPFWRHDLDVKAY